MVYTYTNYLRHSNSTSTTDSRIAHLSTSTGTYERVNVNCLSLSPPLIFMVVGPSLPQSTINSSHVSHYVNYVTTTTQV